jgi:ankyrin repeat protein
MNQDEIDNELLGAAVDGDTINIPELVLTYGANVNGGRSGQPPILSAIQSGHLATVKVLAGLGADVNIANSQGITPFLAAAALGNSDIVRLLATELGANVKATFGNGFCALHIAAAGGFADAVEVLVGECGLDPNTVTASGDSAMLLAAQKGHESVVFVLLELGADPLLANCDGRTAMVEARPFESMLGMISSYFGPAPVAGETPLPGAGVSPALPEPPQPMLPPRLAWTPTLRPSGGHSVTPPLEPLALTADRGDWHGPRP